MNCVMKITELKEKGLNFCLIHPENLFHFAPKSTVQSQFGTLQVPQKGLFIH